MSGRVGSYEGCEHELDDGCLCHGCRAQLGALCFCSGWGWMGPDGAGWPLSWGVLSIWFFILGVVRGGCGEVMSGAGRWDLCVSISGMERLE